MGYDTRLIIGTAHIHSPYGDSTISVGRIIDIDLAVVDHKSRTGRLLLHCRLHRDPKYKFFGDDGDTLIDTDRYGDYITDVPLEELIEAIENDHSDEPYRRFALALPVLREFRDNPAWLLANIVVLQYGH